MKMKLEKVLTKIPSLPWRGVEQMTTGQFELYRAYGLHAANHFLEMRNRFRRHLEINEHDTKKCNCDNCRFLRQVDIVEYE